MFFCICALLPFIYQPVVAQHLPVLVNSSTILEDAGKLNDDGKHKEALALFTKVSKSDTNYQAILYEMSYTAFQDSQFDVAEQYARQGMELFPENTYKWYRLLGNCYIYQEKYKQAISFFDSGLNLDTYSYLGWYNKGVCLYNLDSLETAKRCFQKAVLLNPYHTSSHYFLGAICTKQGKISEAFLSFVTSLLINPNNRFLNNTISYLNALSKVTDEISGYAANAVTTDNDNFELLQEILLNKISLDEKYKLQTDLDDPITRQLQVLLEKLDYNEADKGFWMQYYVPFYTNTYKNGQFNAFVNYIFSGLNIKSVKNFNEKNKKEVDDFTSTAVNYLNLIRRTEAVNYADRTFANYKYYYGDETLGGKGKWTNNGTDDIFQGSWEFYYNNGKIKSKGVFNNDGSKEGNWQYYYDNGVLKEKEAYKADSIEGVSEDWFSNGIKSEESIYKNGKLNGLSAVYFYNGLPKSIEHYANDLKLGEAKNYTYDGFLNYTSNYKNNELDGEVKLYYKDGTIKSAKIFVNGELNGQFKHYSEKGVLDQEGNYINGKETGEWKEYYDSTKVKAVYTYVDGELDGAYKTYYENGKLNTSTNYTNGKINGKHEYFDEDGIKSNEITYEKGKLKEAVFFDKTGKIISSSTTRKGAAYITFYDASGNKTSEGNYNKDGYNDGKYFEYYKSGKIKNSLSYNNGMRDGERILFYPDSTISEKLNFTNDNENGLLTSYYPNGSLKYAGNYVDGDKQGEQQHYNMFNTMVSSANYLNDEPDGYYTTYAPNGKILYEDRYKTGWLTIAKQFDSTGKLISENNLQNGNCEFVYKYPNGNTYIKVPYKNYLMHGKYESFYFDGKPMIVLFYQHNQEDSISRRYFYNGKLAEEGNYKIGNKVGTWKYYYSSGKLHFSDEYDNGKLNGVEVSYNQDGTKYMESHFSNDELDGVRTIYGADNEVAVELTYHNGILVSYSYEGKDGKPGAPVMIKDGTGLITAYYKNGIKSAEINYEESLVNGIRKIYASNGNLLIDDPRFYNDENGIKKQYSATGQLLTEENYYYGTLHGISKDFYANGNIRDEENWYDGNRNGTSKHYDETGKLTETRFYYYGLLLNVKK